MDILILNAVIKMVNLTMIRIFDDALYSIIICIWYESNHHIKMYSSKNKGDI